MKKLSIPVIIALLVVVAIARTSLKLALKSALAVPPPLSIDAAVGLDNGNTIFFKGERLWFHNEAEIYFTDTLENFFEDSITTPSPPIRDIDAATLLPNGGVIIYKGERLWYGSLTNEAQGIKFETTKLISEAADCPIGGCPTNDLDAACHLPDERIIWYKNNQYWIWQPSTNSFTESGYFSQWNFSTDPPPPQSDIDATALAYEDKVVIYKGSMAWFYDLEQSIFNQTFDLNNWSTQYDYGLKPIPFYYPDKRFINPPIIRWFPDYRAVSYRIEISKPREAPLITEQREENSLDLKDYWSNLDSGYYEFRIYSLNSSQEVINTSALYNFYKAYGFIDNPSLPEPPFSSVETIEKIFDFLTADMGSENIDPTLPPYIWYAVITKGNQFPYRYSFPAFHHALGINAFLDYYQYSQDSPKKQQALDRAKQLANWNIAKSTPAHYYLPFLPYSTTENGSPGGHKDGDNLQPDKSAFMGLSYLRVYQATNENQYLLAAVDIANSLLKIQRPNGSWPFRINPENGKIAEGYTGSAIFQTMLFEKLSLIDLPEKETYSQASQKSRDWLLRQPLEDNRWEAFYEDVDPLEGAYSNLENFDAIQTANFLVSKLGTHPEYREKIEKIINFVEDEFAVYQPLSDDPILDFFYHPYTPSLVEQKKHAFPMNGHAANVAMLFSELCLNGFGEVFCQKAGGFAKTITWCQKEDGKNLTYVPDISGEEIPRANTVWYSGMFISLSALIKTAPQTITLSPGWNEIVWPGVAGKKASDVPDVCPIAVSQENSWLKPYVRDYGGVDFDFESGRTYYLKCNQPTTWTLAL